MPTPVRDTMTRARECSMCSWGRLRAGLRLVSCTCLGLSSFRHQAFAAHDHIEFNLSVGHARQAMCPSCQSRENPTAAHAYTECSKNCYKGMACSSVEVTIVTPHRSYGHGSGNSDPTQFRNAFNRSISGLELYTSPCGGPLHVGNLACFTFITSPPNIAQ